MTNLLLIGAGKWGKNYISTLSNFPDVSLAIANRHNWKEEIDKKPDGVMICTPPQSHIEIASFALSHNIPTMIEKPLALSLKDAEILQQYAAPILVNHTDLFSSVYQGIKTYTNSSELTHVYGLNVGPALSRDYSELWDYGPHDIAMTLDVVQQMPYMIECKLVSDRRFVVTLKFDNNVKAVSLMGFEETRKRSWQVAPQSPHALSIYTKDCDIVKPLTNALHVFIGAIHGKLDYRLGLNLSLDVMKVLEQCQESLDQHKIIYV
jgi:predicted dehydrogenase